MTSTTTEMSQAGPDGAGEDRELIEEIGRLRRERNAVILAHTYQIPAVQDIADFVGDSLGLSRQAASTDAAVIVFAGVHFMAETAAILSPDKTVLLPDLSAGCSLAASITADQLRDWKAEHPGAVVVSYVNTSAEVKAESDYCCTSANAVEVVRSIPADREVLFLPDLFLGEWVRRETGRTNMHLWLGECHVHGGIVADDVDRARALHPDAELLVHPECACGSKCLLDLQSGRLDAARTRVLSTEGMVRYAASAQARRFLVATETGVLHRLHRQA
ncbi:MAG TPA: quinolinate synthase NadA, partial [Thermomicrobiaceae bacterium]|nr:quinolinate synthase NadA [Thermomicrobiaceae bacterium]